MNVNLTKLITRLENEIIIDSEVIITEELYKNTEIIYLYFLILIYT